MKHKYDHMLRDNLKDSVIASAETFFGMKVVHYQLLDTIETVTQKREVDFICIVELADGSKRLLQIEFQTQDDQDMVFRMRNYWALYQDRYRLPMDQFVLYLGQKPSKMATSIQQVIPDEKQNYAYGLLSLRDLNYEQLLTGGTPGTMVLAILANFSGQAPEQVIKQIVKSIQRSAPTTALLEKYLRQLIHFSGLRNLDIETKKIVKAMPIEYDYTQHILFKDGVKLGEERGEERGRKLGEERGRKLGEERGRKLGEERGELRKSEVIATNMLKKGHYSTQEIAELTGLTEAQIQRLQGKL